MYLLYNFRNLTLKGVIENHTEVSWIVDYQDGSKVEMTLDIAELNNIKINDLIYNDILKDYAIVHTILINENVIKVQASGLVDILKDRVHFVKRDFKGTKINLKNLVVAELNKHLSSLSLNLSFSDDLIFDSSQIEFKIEPSTLLKLLNDFIKKFNYGLKTEINFKTKQINLIVHQGVNRSINQQSNKKIIISKNRNNILKTNYLISEANYKNVCYGMTKNKTLKVEILQDLPKKEMVLKIDEDNLTDEAIKVRAMSELLKYNKIFEVNFEIDTENLIYGKDYFIGDVLTFKDIDYNFIKNTKITAIKTLENHNGLRMGVTTE